MTHRFEARESVGFQATWRIGQAGEAVDITGWAFTATFYRQKGSPLFTLNMAGSLSPSVEGFFVFNGPAGQLAINILPATLQGIPDTTGKFTIFGDLLGTPPAAAQQLVKHLRCKVTSLS